MCTKEIYTVRDKRMHFKALFTKNLFYVLMVSKYKFEKLHKPYTLKIPNFLRS